MSVTDRSTNSAFGGLDATRIRTALLALAGCCTFAVVTALFGSSTACALAHWLAARGRPRDRSSGHG